MRSTLDNLLGHLEKIQGANLGNLPPYMATKPPWTTLAQ